MNEWMNDDSIRMKIILRPLMCVNEMEIFDHLLISNKVLRFLKFEDMKIKIRRCLFCTCIWIDTQLIKNYCYLSGLILFSLQLDSRYVRFVSLMKYEKRFRFFFFVIWYSFIGMLSIIIIEIQFLGFYGLLKFICYWRERIKSEI